MPLCKPCSDRGFLSVAKRKVNSSPMCEACFNDKPPKGIKTKVVDASSVPPKRGRETAWTLIADMMAQLALGKALCIAIPDGKKPENIMTALRQTCRRRYKFHVQARHAESSLYVWRGDKILPEASSK